MNEATYPEIGAGVSSYNSGFAWLIGWFFCVRSAFTVLLVRVCGLPSHAGVLLSLGVESTLLMLTLLDAALRYDEAAPHLRSHSAVQRWVLLYLLFTGASLSWGTNASIGASFAYWAATASDVAMIWLLLHAGDNTTIQVSVLKGFAQGAGLIAVAAWMMPVQYDLRLGDENFFNANTIGNICAFGIFFAQYLRRIGAGAWTSTTSLLAITLLRTLSKSSIAAFSIAGAYLLVQDRSLSRRAKLSVVALTGMVTVVFWSLLEAYYDVYTSTGNQAQTLTGRTAIWLYVVNNVGDHLWVGHGFDSMWNTVPPFGTFQPRHAENEVLHQLYAYGLSGVLLWGRVYWSYFRACAKSTHTRVRVVLVSILLYVVVRGLAEAEPFDLLLPLWTIVLLSTPATIQVPLTVAAAGRDVDASVEVLDLS